MGQVDLNSTCLSAEDFLADLYKESHVDVKKCYQCGTCAAGCSVGYASDCSPRQLMRMLQLGLTEEVLKSSLIWLCVGCGNCVTRCPRNLNVPHLNDTLRIMAKEKGYIAEKNVDVFSNIFLYTIEKFGRLFEGGLTMGFNMRTMQPFKDVIQAPRLIARGKLKAFPHVMKDRKQMKKLFKKVKEMRGEAK